MKRADDQVLQALVALNGNPYFERIKVWFKESLDEQREANDIEPRDVELRQGQGKAQIEAEFLKEADDAVANWRKTSSSTTTRHRET